MISSVETKVASRYTQTLNKDYAVLQKGPEVGVIKKGDDSCTFGYLAVHKGTLQFDPSKGAKIQLHGFLVPLNHDYGLQDSPRYPRNIRFLQWDPKKVAVVRADFSSLPNVWFMVSVDGYFVLCCLPTNTEIKASPTCQVVLDLPVFAWLKHKTDSSDAAILSYHFNEHKNVFAAVYGALQLIGSRPPSLQWTFTNAQPNLYYDLWASKMIKEETRKWCDLDWDKPKIGHPDSSRAKEQDASLDERREHVEPSTKRRKKNSLESSAILKAPSKRSYSRKQKNPRRYGLQPPSPLVTKAKVNSAGTQGSKCFDLSPTKADQQEWEVEKEQELGNGKIAIFWKNTHYIGLQGEAAFYQDLDKFRGQWNKADQNGKDGDAFRALIKWHVTKEDI